GDELRQCAARHENTLRAVLGDQAAGPLGGTVVQRNGVPVAGQVASQVAPHHGQADHADLPPTHGGLLSHLRLPPRHPPPGPRLPAPAASPPRPPPRRPAPHGLTSLACVRRLSAPPRPRGAARRPARPARDGRGSSCPTWQPPPERPTPGSPGDHLQ